MNPKLVQNIDTVERMDILVPQRRLGVPTCKLPHSLTLFGRSSIIADIVKQLICDIGIVGVSAVRGLPGIGKTDLVRAVGCDPSIIDHFNGGVFYAELGQNADASLILRGWLTEVDISVPIISGDDPQILAAVVRQMLGNQHALFILDDVWQTTFQTAKVLRDCMTIHCGLLVSSRSTDIARTVAKDQIPIKLNSLDYNSALALLHKHAQGDETNPVDADLENAGKLVVALGNLPLALKLAGRLLRNARRDRTPCVTLLQTWHQRLDEMRGDEPRPGNQEDELSLDAIIALSYDGLPKEELRTRAAALSVFGSVSSVDTSELSVLSWSWDAIVAVWECTQQVAENTEGLLVQCGLLDYNKDTQRYYLHQTIHAFFQHRCILDVYSQRHALYYASLLERYDPEIVKAKGNVQLIVSQLDAEISQIERGQAYVMSASLSKRHDEVLIMYALHCNNYFNIRSRYDQLLMWSEQGRLAAQRQGRFSDAAKLLSNIGAVYHLTQRYDEAIFAYQESLLIKQRNSILSDQNILFATIGNVYTLQERYAEAITNYQKSIAISQNIEDTAMVATVLNQIGVIHEKQEHYIEAISFYESSRETSREINDIVSIAIVLGNIGGVYKIQNKYLEAVEYFQQSLEIYQRVFDKDGSARTIWSLLTIYRKQGSLDIALPLMEWFAIWLEENGLPDVVNLQVEIEDVRTELTLRNASELQ